jgi:hypothetical protein
MLTHCKSVHSLSLPVTPTQLRRLFLFSEDTDKPIDQITHFKESKTWKENIVLDALHKELQLQNLNPEKVALFTKYIFYVRQKNRKPFMERYHITLHHITH